jgi:hypothetical protein
VRPSLWRVTELLAACLTPAEREAVLGDLTESKRPFFAGISDIAGLALRRGGAACREPRTAIAFFLLVLPLSFLLASQSRETANFASIYLWIWANNLDLHLLTNAGFWHGVAESGPPLLFTCGMLALYGWSASMLAALVSRSAAKLLCLVLLVTAIAGIPFALSQPIPYAGEANDPIFRLAFYRLFFPCLVQCVFVLLPALFAIRQPRTENV